MSEKKWYVAFINDPKKRAALPSAMQSVTRDFTIWAPTRQEVREKKENRGGNNQGRRVTNTTDFVVKPLFPGYVFLNFDYASSGVEDAIKAQCGGYLLYAPGADNPEPLTEEQVSHIKQLAEEQNAPRSMADRYNFQLGQEVEIAGGPLFGQKGFIREIKRATVIVEVAMFGRETVRAEVTPNQCLTVE